MNFNSFLSWIAPIAPIAYLLTGLLLAELLLPERRLAVRVWLGLVFGCVLLMWLPCLFAFLLGFNMTAQVAALILCILLALLCLHRLRGEGREYFVFSGDLIGFGLSLALTAFCAYLLHTHVLLQKPDGSLWVGQSTYGDLAMHLGFIDSSAQQGRFPPEYSIFPGQQLNYPFLVDAASAGLRFFNYTLRGSVIVPSLVMLFCVFWGFWLLAEQITKNLFSIVTAWLLFVFNGGFGFLLFLGKYPFSAIFTGYYTTPTNFASEDIRWVNVICDMLIPQRTTMAGWCVLLAAIYLLNLVLRESAQGRGLRQTLVLAVLAGAMPMIHTHSFLALGILSAVLFFCWLPAAKKEGHALNLVKNYVIYGLLCLALAAPQFFKWTMDSVSTGNLLRWNLGWVAGAHGAIKSWLLFYVVNCGVIFVLLFPAAFFLRGEKLRLFLAASAIFLIANVVAFQPNLYDNNKLLYVWFMLTDILVCDWLCGLLSKLKKPALRRVLALLLVFLGTFSGLLSLGRETISEYELLSGEQHAASTFIIQNTPVDSLFLTASNHTNTVSVLTGRNILCGPGLYLYYHGVNYQQREAQIPELYRGGEAFVAAAEEYGIDYVYVGAQERSAYEVNSAWFAEHYPLIYDRGGIQIYQINKGL